MRRIFLYLLSACLLGASAPSFACSAFASQNSRFQVLAKSYDWQMSHGLAFINKRGVRKVALVRSAKDRPLEWTSIYGSLTYSQFGREFPISGLNERGLAIEILWDFGSPGPSGGDKPVVNEAQWIQFQLDTAATVEEMIQNLANMRMKNVYAPIHYFACDSAGECATFEFDGLNVLVHRSGHLPYKVLTNSPYEESMRYLTDFLGFGGQKEIPWTSRKSNDRFVILAESVKELNVQNSAKSAEATAWKILRLVRQPGFSVWNLVHDLKERRSSFIRLFDETAIKVTHLDEFDLSCRAPVKMLDLEGPESGMVDADYVNYDESINRASVELSGQGLGIDKELVDAVANYPRTTICTE
ncbi:MAG: linear amide C-N hydrolase [Bdellovibrionales bacterium]